MAGKRHHYLPQFLLRRFAAASGPYTGRTWRGDLDGSRFILVAPKHEAAKRHYYKLPAEHELPMPVEDLLQLVESGASTAIINIERNQALSRDDREYLALFLLLQHRRTPAGRRELHFMDELVAKLDMEVRLSSKSEIRQALASTGEEVTDEELESWRLEQLADLREGRLLVESTPDREVVLMFQHLDRLAPKLVTDFDWRFLRVPAEVGEVVLPDVGVTMFDPTPQFPQSGTGLQSSPNSETVLHLAPDLVLIIRPGKGSGALREATAEQVERLNLRAVACSDKCIYSRSRETLGDVLAKAGADPERIETLRPRAPVLWIAEGEGEPVAGPITFTGYSLDGTLTQELIVSEEGIEDARRRAYRVPE